ncbi:MAG: penicillin-binding protein [Myxococcaceae bacterium]|nr:penicillin-binding protein [Myxococcaceae bacterium]
MSDSRTRSLYLALSLACACGNDVPAERDDTSSIEGELQSTGRYSALVDRVRSEIESSGVPGAALAIIEGREVKLVIGIGRKSADAPEPVDADTMFRIGSLSKTFTAATAVQLASEHLFSLDAPIARYVPDLELVGASEGRPITLRRLLSHTAGLPDYIELSCPTGDGALESWFRSHAPITVEAEPGRVYNYTNLGFALAGYTMERAAHRPFVELVEKTLIEPLALTSTTYDVQRALSGDHATGHAIDVAVGPGDPPYDATSAQCAMAQPPGMLWSSARDLATFVQALLRGAGGVLDRRALANLVAPETRMGSPPNAVYDLGLVTQPLRGEIAVWHNGALPGFHAMMVTVPARGAGLVLLTNGDGYDPTAAGLDMIGDLLNLPDAQPVDLTTQPSAWQAYVGTYQELDQGGFPGPSIGQLVIELRGTQLVALLPMVDTDVHVLTQRAGDGWSLDVDGQTYPLTFWRDAGGQAEYVTGGPAILRRTAP